MRLLSHSLDGRSSVCHRERVPCRHPRGPPRLSSIIDLPQDERLSAVGGDMTIQEAVNKATEGGYHMHGSDGIDTDYGGANSEYSVWTRKDGSATHPLEGSCQEAIRHPYTTFDNFFPLRSTRQTLPPTCGLRRVPVFVPAVSASMRRTIHPSGSRPLDVSLPSQTSAPGTFCAPENRRFPPVSNRVSRTDRMAPSRVQFQLGSRQRRRTTPQSGGRPFVTS
jgi:hypothetical protein